ncbi:protein kinase [Streptomyces hyaluromycini]|uniref:non-specific serine/threonine protein kinase n=1 Tax=Streptomyces hyaluromycini TaxID=1377993 RepID=A0ABV1WXP8_9ACTN
MSPHLPADETPTDPATGSEAARAFVVPGSIRGRKPPSDQGNGLFAGPNHDPDRFELIGQGLRGSEGITWRGRYRGALRRPVTYAVKQLLRPPSAPGSWPAQADIQRWQDQRHLLQAVRNDHLVRVHDLFFGPEPHQPATYPPVADGREYWVPYLVMEWVNGPTLQAGISQGDFDLAQRLRCVRDLAEAVSVLHSATQTSGNPVLHRDIKPDNCIQDPERGTVLVDLGTLRRIDDGYDSLGMHTRQYAAPEVLRDPFSPRTQASDLYALGAVAYFCIVAAPPPADSGPSAARIMRQELTAAVQEWKPPDARAFADHIMLMLDPDPARRPSRPQQWADEALVLAGCPLAPSPRRRPRRRRRTLALALALTTVLAATVTKLLPSSHPPSGRQADVHAFRQFGNEYIPFPAHLTANRITLSPPGGQHRYDHLWGAYAPADACATTLTFDARMTHTGPQAGYGYAIAPRSSMDDTRTPHGYSVQYEWQSPDINAKPGAYLRPAELPGGAWEGTTDPSAAPDITQSHHVSVSATGTTLKMTVDHASVAYQLPAVECGGITIRAWGATLDITHLKISAT